jgi:hypothetical protein
VILKRGERREEKKEGGRDWDEDSRVNFRLVEGGTDLDLEFGQGRGEEKVEEG